MPLSHCGFRQTQVARKWHALAERRLAHFNELYRSGRWQRYYSQEEFALRMLDVIKAARVWEELAKVPPSLQPSASPPRTHDDDLRPAA